MDLIKAAIMFSQLKVKYFEKKSVYFSAIACFERYKQLHKPVPASLIEVCASMLMLKHGMQRQRGKSKSWL